MESQFELALDNHRSVQVKSIWELSFKDMLMELLHVEVPPEEAVD